MQFASSSNPAHCVSKDASRYKLGSIYIDKGLALSTCGRTMFCCIVHENGDADAFTEDDTITRGCLPKEAATMSYKNKHAKGCFFFSQGKPGDDLNRPIIHVKPSSDSRITFDGTSTPSVNDIFNPWKLLPKQTDSQIHISFNAKLLANISKCMGQTDLTITIDKENLGGVMVVSSNKNPDAIALLMPLSLPEQNPYKNNAYARIEESFSAEPEVEGEDFSLQSTLTAPAAETPAAETPEADSSTAH